MFGKKTSDSKELVSVRKVSKNEAVRQKNSDIKVQGTLHNATKNPSIDNNDWHNIDVFFKDKRLENSDFINTKVLITESIMDRVDFSLLEHLSSDVKKARVKEVVAQIIVQEIKTPLTSLQVELLKEQAVDDLLGFGPLELLMADDDIADIMINGSGQVYIERYGKILLTDLTFTSERHLINIIQKIVSLVGRRVDESSPMVDARMPDGSRFNAIIPPIALDGSLVSIRKFRKSKMTLKEYIDVGSMSIEMANFLAICGAIRLNIIISGGTGSGKTTLLNALSGNIDHRERVITVEDAAELQLQQPHVLRMETRPPNMQGAGEITSRQLVKNALRMRPDRIIIGEIRGDEVIDVLSAMNTGHDGSMATIHANTPRDALSRIENLVGMSNVSLSNASLRNQIVSAVHLIVQVARQRDGKRRITHIEEVYAMEEGELITKTLFGYKAGQIGEDGVLQGEFFCSGICPRFISQAAYFGREKEMLATLGLI